MEQEPAQIDSGSQSNTTYNKESIAKMECTLTNLVSILRWAFEQVKVVANQDVVVALGNTGCGKSTMFTSLIYGSSALELKQLEEAVKEKQKNGPPKEKIAKRWIIERKPDFTSTEFKIGHNEADSMTFIPDIVKSKESETFFADIAGLQDPSGDLTEFVNCFVTKFIFKQAKRVRFLIPLTLSQIQEVRGKPAREQLKIVSNICSERLDVMIESIQPILTKVDPTDQDVDIELICHSFAEQLSQEVQALRAADGILQQQEMEPDEDDGEEKNGDTQKQIEKFNELEQFYKSFAYKLRIYDPLERRIPELDPDAEEPDEAEDDSDAEENVNQAVSREELLNIIEKMPTMRGDLNVPMSNEMYTQLENLLQAEDAKCKDLAETYFMKARNDDVEFELNFCDEPIVKNCQETLHFFK